MSLSLKDSIHDLSQKIDLLDKAIKKKQKEKSTGQFDLFSAPIIPAATPHVSMDEIENRIDGIIHHLESVLDTYQNKGDSNG
jgi:hypothetical protein